MTDNWWYFAAPAMLFGFICVAISIIAIGDKKARRKGGKWYIYRSLIAMFLSLSVAAAGVVVAGLITEREHQMQDAKEHQAELFAKAKHAYLVRSCTALHGVWHQGMCLKPNSILHIPPYRG